MLTNHGKEDGIYPLKRDSKAQNKDQRSIVTTCKTPIKDLRFQLIENIIVQYCLVWAKKVTLAAICLEISSASFGIRIN